MGKNRTHVMISSNATWVVPASSDERRFCVTEALDTKLNDFKYFDAITDELENGGYEAMLYDLLTRDLSGFNVFTVPKTKALDDQKSESMSGEYKWWRDVLYSGCLGGLFGQKWNEQFANKTLYQSYLASKPYRPLSKYNFGRFLSPMSQKDARVLNAGKRRFDLGKIRGHALLASPPPCAGKTEAGFLALLACRQMRRLDQPDDLGFLGCGVSHSSASPSAIMLFWVGANSRACSATTSFSARASWRRSLTSPLVAARAVSPEGYSNKL